MLLTPPSSCEYMFIHVAECLADQSAQNFIYFGQTFVAAHPLE